MNRQEAMLNMQIKDFALYDTILFLDTHPKDESALEYYQDAKKQYLEAVMIYEDQFGPVTSEDVDAEKSWQWVNSPWPWEWED